MRRFEIVVLVGSPEGGKCAGNVSRGGKLAMRTDQEQGVAGDARSDWVRKRSK